MTVQSPLLQDAASARSGISVRAKCVAVLCISWLLLLCLSVASGLQKFLHFNWDQSVRIATVATCGFALLLILGNRIARASPVLTKLALNVSLVLGVVCLATYVWFGSEVWFDSQRKISIYESNGRYYNRGGDREFSEQQYIEYKRHRKRMGVTVFGTALSGIAVVSSLYLIGTGNRHSRGL